MIGIFLLVYYRAFAFNAIKTKSANRWLTMPYLWALYFLVIATSLFGLRQPGNVVAQARNFFGCYHVVLYDDAVGLFDGDTLHGLQWRSPEKQQEPTKYYKAQTGFWHCEKLLRERHTGPLNIAVVGLGTGTIACYGRPGDHIVFYEIDPKVVFAANKYFSFLKASRAT